MEITRADLRNILDLVENQGNIINIKYVAALNSYKNNQVAEKTCDVMMEANKIGIEYNKWYMALNILNALYTDKQLCFNVLKNVRANKLSSLISDSD